MAIGTAAALIGGSLIGGAASVFGAGKAADAQAAGSQAAVDEQRRQFNTVMRLTKPQRKIGRQAINELSQVFGFKGNKGLDAFEASPDFEFRRGEGLEGIAQTLGAGGAGAFSGNALRGMIDFNSNLASGEFSNFVNRRLALAGLGQTANSDAGSAALTTGANTGNALINQGNARQSGILGATSAISGTIKDIIDAIVARNTQNAAIDNELLPIFDQPGLF